MQKKVAHPLWMGEEIQIFDPDLIVNAKFTDLKARETVMNFPIR
jgi:hypothetical protein